MTRSYNFWRATLKVIGLLTCLVWLSSYMQLQFLSNWQVHLIKKVSYFWVVGLSLDVVTLLFFSTLGLISKRPMSSISLSLPFYLLAILVNGRPTILIVNSITPLLESIVKVLEFWILSFLHLMLAVVIPGWINTYISRNN
jgi:hypothetical protein